MGKYFNIKTAGIWIIIAFTLLLFLSKTIYKHNLPEISAGMPATGKLTKKERTKGIAQYARTNDIYSQVPGKVSEIFVKEGDKVKKGQELMKFSYELTDIEDTLKDIEISKSKLYLDISGTKFKIDNLSKEIKDLRAEQYKPESISAYDMRQTETEIEEAKKEQETYKILYESGAVSKQELDGKDAHLKALLEKYNNQKDQYEKSTEKESKTLQEKEKDREKKITEYETEIVNLKRDLNTKNLDLQKLSLDEEKNKTLLEKYQGNVLITAENDGTVLSINAKNGETITANHLIISVAEGTGFEIKTNISLNNNFVQKGDTVKISNSMSNFTATVSKIEPKESAKEVTLEFVSDKTSNGETFDAEFKKESSTQYKLVPNKAVNKDSDGYYLNRVKRRDGLLGKEFYTEKLRISIGDNDDEYTAVIDGITFFEPIVTGFNKPFKENQTIKLLNEGDFFAS